MPVLAIAALPLAFLVIGLVALFRLPPIWRLYPDPAYQYLLNGLGVTVGPGTGHTDHPGTSLQWLVGFINLGYHAVATTGVSLIEDVTRRPEDYLRVSAFVLIALQAVALYLLGSRLRAAMGMGSALLAQAAVVGTAAFYPYRLYTIPESLVIICGIALLALVAPKLSRPGGESGPWIWIGLGVVMAVGITAKVIFLPMLLIPLFLYPWRTLLRAYAVFIVSVIVIMWVTRDQLQRMYDWYTAVAKTSARYPDEVVTRSLTDGLRDIPGATLQYYPVVVIALAVVVLGLVLRARHAADSSWWRSAARVLGALVVAVLTTLAMTYKAFRVNDLLLLAPLAGVLAAVGWSYVTQAEISRASHGRLIIIPAGAAVVSVALGVQAAATFLSNATAETGSTQVVAYLDQQVAVGTNVATGYGVFSQGAALYWANEWARYVSLPQTLATYPGWLEYNIWNGLFYTFNPTDGTRLATCQELTDIVNSPGGLLVAPGRAFTPDTSGLQSVQLRYQPERVFGDQIVYRVQGVTCP